MIARHLYVHVPFCRRRCVYCDFSIAVRRTVPAAQYLDALEREWERVARRSGCAAMPDGVARPEPRAGGSRPAALDPGRISTLYLGGGTPSLLGGAGIARITHLLCRGSRLEECTIEANPDDVTPEAAQAWVRAGVTRLSLGAQSFDADVLRWMHRTHDAAAIGRAVGNARRAGFANVSLDLIFALPAALGRDLDADLDRVFALEPEHVSLYGLTVEDHTPLGRSAARGDSSPAPEQLYEEEYLRILGRLTAGGYRLYEVANAARPGFEAVHNRAYWRLAPYLGLGPSAHSFDGTARWWNEAAYARWQRLLARGESPVAGREILRPEQARLEALYLGLRTSEGIELPEPVTPQLAATVSSWVAAGWAEVSGGRVTLTPRGWLRLDELTASL